MPFGIGTAGYVTRLRKRNTHTLQGVQGVFNHWTAPDNYWYGTAVPGRTRCDAHVHMWNPKRFWISTKSADFI